MNIKTSQVGLNIWERHSHSHFPFLLVRMEEPEDHVYGQRRRHTTLDFPIPDKGTNQRPW